jgi:hypothetical protein
MATMPAITMETRPQHQVLVDEFMELDKEVQDLVEKFTSGAIIFDCVPADGAKDYAELFSKMQAKFVAAQDYAKQLIEKRNAKLQEAAGAMRGTVIAGEKTLRGPDGKGSSEKYGPFEVNSKTSRSFDWAILSAKVQELGLFDRLKEVTYVNKDNGQSEPAIREEVTVKYEPIKNWLREQNMESVLQAAYEEEEGTPAVTGPKPLGWIGDENKNAKKGKKG